MSSMNCEMVRDQLPELIGGTLDATTHARVRAHIDGCDDCTIELAIAESVADARLAVPAGLSERVRAATSGRRVTYWTRTRMAAAATFAVAIIGGSALIAPYLNRAPIEEPVAEVNAPAAPGAGWFGVDDAFVSGASSLQDLTEEELKQLLVELDS